MAEFYLSFTFLGLYINLEDPFVRLCVWVFAILIGYHIIKNIYIVTRKYSCPKCGEIFRPGIITLVPMPWKYGKFKRLLDKYRFICPHCKEIVYCRRNGGVRNFYETYEEDDSEE